MSGREELFAAAHLAQQRAIELRARSEHVLRSADKTMAHVLATQTDGQLARLRAEVQGLREALETRAVIEQAKGILIATTGCDAERAFEMLRQQSQHENRKVRDVAAELVARHHRTSGMRLSPSQSPRR